MGAKENNLAAEYLSKMPDNERMFRTNSGMAWAGKRVKQEKGFLLLQNPRPFNGLPDGFSDYFGWETIEITPDMVGQKIAIAKAIEVKATGRLSKQQQKFQAMCNAMGVRHTVLTPDSL